MGQTISVQSQSAYRANLTFIESSQDKNFGHIDIYRTKEAPYQYIMDFKKNFIEDPQSMSRFTTLVSQLKNMDHKNLAKIYHSEVYSLENQVCIKHKKIHTYCNYYNFTLEAAIEKKKLQDSYFPQSELVYILGSLLEAASFLQKYGVAVGEYRCRNIYLSPEGYVKLFLLEVEEENRHSCYYKVLSQRHLLEEFILSPQQLVHLSRNDFDPRYDLFKSEVFAIGMILLELITLDRAKFYYNENKSELKIDRISFDISSVGKGYSQPFINLLRHCLQPLPSNRCSIDEALNELNSIRRAMKALSYCVRLQQDQQKSKKNAQKRQLTMSLKGQHILSGLQKKLTPSPIITLTSSTSTNFKAESKTSSSRNSQVGSIKF